VASGSKGGDGESAHMLVASPNRSLWAAAGACGALIAAAAGPGIAAATGHGHGAAETARSLSSQPGPSDEPQVCAGCKPPMTWCLA
jgi:hypothetical protein